MRKESNVTFNKRHHSLPYHIHGKCLDTFAYICTCPVIAESHFLVDITTKCADSVDTPQLSAQTRQVHTKRLNVQMH